VFNFAAAGSDATMISAIVPSSTASASSSTGSAAVANADTPQKTGKGEERRFYINFCSLLPSNKYCTAKLRTRNSLACEITNTSDVKSFGTKIGFEYVDPAATARSAANSARPSLFQRLRSHLGNDAEEPYVEVSFYDGQPCTPPTPTPAPHASAFRHSARPGAASRIQARLSAFSPSSRALPLANISDLLRDPTQTTSSASIRLYCVPGLTNTRPILLDPQPVGASPCHRQF
jgi:hypothetical protein